MQIILLTDMMKKGYITEAFKINDKKYCIDIGGSKYAVPVYQGLTDNKKDMDNSCGSGIGSCNGIFRYCILWFQS